MKKLVLATLIALVLVTTGCLSAASKVCMLGCGFIPQDNIYVTTGKNLCEAFCKSDLVAEGDKWWNEKVAGPDGWLGKFQDWIQKYVSPEVLKAKLKAKAPEQK